MKLIDTVPPRFRLLSRGETLLRSVSPFLTDHDEIKYVQDLLGDPKQKSCPSVYHACHAFRLLFLTFRVLHLTKRC